MKQKVLYGVGINDADYEVRTTNCPYYVTWKNMLTRCYSPAEHKRKPHYADCSVHPSWLSFMTFKSWMVQQDWQGKHLDKDLKVSGNKVYGPDTCMFISLELNNLFGEKGVYKKALPQGVFKDGRNNRFYAQLCKDRVVGYLGRFDSAEEAGDAYKAAKVAYMREVAMRQTDLSLKAVLLKRADTYAC